MDIGRKVRWPALLLCAVLLSACQSGLQTRIHMATLDVLEVTLPASAGANADLEIHLTAGEGCFKSLPDIVAERSAQALRLTVQRTVTGDASATCLPVYFKVETTYTDSGSLPRTDPFEVFVNGKSYGTVAVR